MKLNTTTKRTKGMTLLELTVVILVLLSLITILFIGARAWKKGSDRAGCIMNIRNAQQAIRSYQNMYNVKPYPDDTTAGGPIPAGEIVGAGKFMEVAPVCPGGGTYEQDLSAEVPAVPAIGTPYLTCTLATDDGHVPLETNGW